jgi:hypothetical protein
MDKDKEFPVLNPQQDTQPWRFDPSKSREHACVRNDAMYFAFATGVALSRLARLSGR